MEGGEKVLESDSEHKPEELDEEVDKEFYNEEDTKTERNEKEEEMEQDKIDATKEAGDVEEASASAAEVDAEQDSLVPNEISHQETQATIPERHSEEADEMADETVGNSEVDKGKDELERKLENSGPVDGLSPLTRGDEDEITSEQIIGDEEEEKIPDDFYYDFQEHVSKPLISDDTILPPDVLTLVHSFGYDCLKRSNLHVLQKDVVAFAAGNFVQIVNLKTKQSEYIRSTFGGGIGALMVHPTKQHLAVAEKGFMPNINIYEYPSLRLYRILRGGTQTAYSYVDFSPDGKLLASVGSDPDYMLTLWDWKQEKIVLRSKAFSQDIFRVTFSVELEGQLTSSGIGHIRFWKMARTFTGLKLQGQLGKFGKKEISDIEGYVELPDGKVLSGSEWGNMLLWDGGLIKVEISRKNKRPCHQGSIQQIIMDEGELMTIGNDGYIRVWDFETVDNADTTSEVELFEMEPMNELRVGHDVQLRCMVKSSDPDETTFWYAQDANGGIWKLDLSFSFTSAVPEKLFSFHAGPILQCASSPVSHLIATIGVDGTVRIYDYLVKSPVCMARFNLPGTALLWPSKTVDSKGSMVLAGFDDGVLRVLSLQKIGGIDQHGRKMDKSELVLKQALKPHKRRIVTIDIDSRGQLLATGSTDCTVFFMSIADEYEPIGFVVTPSAVTHIQWSPPSFKQNTLLVCCSEGQVLEIRAPQPGKFDTSHTFQIEGLIERTHQFKSVKSILRHEEELARLAREEEERRRQEEEEERIRQERGIESDPLNNADKKQNDEKKEEPWEPYIPEKPSPILCGFYAKEEGKFWLSMGGYDSGYLYECEFLDEEQKKTKPRDMLYEPCRIIPVDDSNDIAIQSVRFSSNSQRLFFGMENGAIRIQLIHDEDPGLMGPYWSLTVHDNHYGRINGLCSSFDNKYLFSVATDGNFFMFEMMSDKKLEEAAEAKAKIPSAKKELTEIRVDDIADPKAYSIEDAKQKSEYDKMLKVAEAKKAAVRQMINTLRDKFKNLISRNNALPEQIQISTKEFVMDPEIKKELLHQTSLKISTVEKEKAWEEAKHQLALDKVRSRFKDQVECEFIVVRAFLSDHEISSFRCPRLSKGFQKVKEEIENRRMAQLLKEEMSRQETLIAGDERTEKMEETTGDLDATEAKFLTSIRGSMGERIIKSLAKVEEKKRKRRAKQKQWEELMNSKPDVNHEDPAEMAAIREAEEHMGDYKLKSASDYVVPDHLRMNTEKARIKLVILKEMLHDRKQSFNQRLLSLRDKKIDLVNDVRNLVEKLLALQSQLSPELVQPIPEVPLLDPTEIPEKKYEYTRETLLNYKEELVQREKALTTKTDPLLGNVAGVQPPLPSSLPHPQKNMATAEQEQVTSDAPPPTDMELMLKESEQIQLVYQSDQLHKEIETKLRNFDSELCCLRHDKFQLDIDLKVADLRQVTLYEEFLLLKDFEKRENVLASRVEEKHEEKTDMQMKIIDAVAKLEQKKKDIEKLLEREKAQTAAFLETVADNKFADFLTKVYKKKIRRSKAKPREGQGGDEDSDEESDDGSEYSESEEESESETGQLDLDACPAGCDQNIYDNTCMLREKRLDVEEALVEEKKNRDVMSKDLENMQKKAKVIEAALKTAEQELEAFQLEKQHKLNELDVIITLNLHQIEYIVNGILPNDLSPCLVFESQGMTRLQHRIQELIQERSTQKSQQKDAKRQHVDLVKDRRTFDRRITAMKEECDKLMMQKFGCIVDIEKLETITFNRQIEEAKERLTMVETECANELLQWDDNTKAAKDEMTSVIRRNTALLNQLTMLYGEKKEYEQELDGRQKKLGTEFSGVQRSAIEERQRLIQLVHYQAQEIEAMKDEIVMLSRKGGHILPPAQPPMSRATQAAAVPMLPSI